MPVDQQFSRRHVLKWGTGAATVLIGAAALPNFGIGPALAQDMMAGGTPDLGAGDIGVLNYAYALEQLEAAFYTMVMKSPYSDMSSDETSLLGDIKDHEIAHRDFLKKALADKAIPDLDVDFSKVDFTSRKSVLDTAQTFEDLGVSAYNGAGQLIENPDYLKAAGSIVSVEARHAATIRDLINPDSVLFAGDDVVDKDGLDEENKPATVIKAAGPFIKTKFTAKSLV